MGFAVIVPVFNDVSVVPDAIGSALEQPELSEVIVVDDGSTEGGLAEAVTSVGDERVRLIAQEQSGPAAARNTGAVAGSASHLVFLDADDRLLPDALAQFERVHRLGHPLVRSGALWADQGAATLAVPHPQPYPRGCPLAGSFSIDRDLFLTIGGYDEEFRYGENSELLMRAAAEVGRGGRSVGFCWRPTVQVHRKMGRPIDFYDERRIDAIGRMLALHGTEFGSDPETLISHHGIAARLLWSHGERREARSHAWARVRVCPTSIRAWAQLLRVSTTRPPTAGVR